MGLKKEVIEDFNRIAGLDETQWDHNKHYLPYLLKHIPQNCTASLDIGCGTGEFTRLLAKKSQTVTGLDFSPKMIERAKKRSSQFPNIQYKLGDFLEYELQPEQFDCIVSIATIHHLPLDTFLHKVKGALKPGGVLLVLDLYKNSTISDFLISAIAVPINLLYMLVKTGKVKVSDQDRLAWNQHAKNDFYLKIPEIKEITNSILPKSLVKRHLFWRYSLVWGKPI